jgi:hypothetical protein
MAEQDQATQGKAGSGKWMFWVGWVLSGLPALAMLAGGVFALMDPNEMSKGLEEVGYPAKVAVPLILIQMVSLILYLIPWTSVLGAILVTGYLGGAVATHVRADDGLWFIAVIVGAVLWLGLVLRDSKVRAVVPIRWFMTGKG